ncbi:MAG TPA: outer membrane beta-barrel protein [Mucilaginibacter sp.]|jgi:hypothetical protein|nr:outer membrane beta-barrel protein [Mucilaginibacter sp.]
MKKLSCCIILLFSMCSFAFAQSKSFGPGKINLGVEAADVIGSYSDTYTAGFGFSVKYEVPVNQNLYGTISLGYLGISTKSDSVANRAYRSSYGFLPDKVGLKYCYKGHFFGEVQLGIVFPAGEGSDKPSVHESIVETTFIYSLGVGYTMPHGIEAGLRFESWDEGVAFNQLALRLAYRF